MKKWWLWGILSVMILGVGLYIISISSPVEKASSPDAKTDSDQKQNEANNEEPKEKDNQENTTGESDQIPEDEGSETKDEENNSPTPPSERTVDIGDAVPWEQVGVQAQRQEVIDGGQVYLMKDAEALEEKLITFIDEKPSESYDKMNAAQAWGKQTKTFVLDLEEFYPDRADYFNLMDEASELLVSGDFDQAKERINTAKNKR